MDLLPRPIRVYADTSVFGGMFDEEFKDSTQSFFEQVKAGTFLLVISPLLEDEIVAAPQRVRTWYDAIKPLAEIGEITEAALELRQAYLHAGIVGPKSLADALHVAVATVLGCGIIVSWNFRHIVHFQKIAMYNGVNQMNGYPAIAIHSPREVISYGNEEV